MNIKFSITKCRFHVQERQMIVGKHLECLLSKGPCVKYLIATNQNLNFVSRVRNAMIFFFNIILEMFDKCLMKKETQYH